MSGAFPVPEDSKKCVAITKAGARCKGYAVGYDGRCTAHTLDPEKQNPVVSHPAEMNAHQKALARKKQHEREIAHLNLRDQIRARAESKREQLVDRLLECALHPDPKVALPALTVVMERVLGKVPQAQVNLHGGLSGADVAQLRAAVEGLPPAERLQLARAKLGLPRALDAEVIREDVA